MTISVYLVTYKTDTNPHHPGNPLAFDTRERVIASSTADSAIAYVARDLDLRGVEYHNISAKFHKPYTP